MATPEQIAEHKRLGNDLPHQRATHDAVFALAQKLVYEVPPLAPTKRDMIFFALASRCLESSLSARLLIDQSRPFVDDAASVVRILAEAVIDAGYIVMHDEAMAERFDAWGDYHAYVQEKHSLESFPRADPEAQNEAEKELLALKQAATTQHPEFATERGDWGGNVFSRATAVDTALDAMGGAPHRDFAMLLETWRALSNFVHHNSLSIRRRVSETKNHIRIGREYPDAERANVLYACNEAMFALIMLADIYYWKAQNSNEWKPYLYPQADAVRQNP